MPFHVSYGVACGERTVAACCEIKTGLERGSLVNFGLRGTRNAVAPPLGTLASEARISGPKSSHESGTVCPVPHCFPKFLDFRQHLTVLKVHQLLLQNGLHSCSCNAF